MKKQSFHFLFLRRFKVTAIVNGFNAKRLAVICREPVLCVNLYGLALVAEDLRRRPC